MQFYNPDNLSRGPPKAEGQPVRALSAPEQPTIFDGDQPSDQVLCEEFAQQKLTVETYDSFAKDVFDQPFPKGLLTTGQCGSYRDDILVAISDAIRIFLARKEESDQRQDDTDADTCRLEAQVCVLRTQIEHATKKVTHAELTIELKTAERNAAIGEYRKQISLQLKDDQNTCTQLQRELDRLKEQLRVDQHTLSLRRKRAVDLVQVQEKVVALTNDHLGLLWDCLRFLLRGNVLATYSAQKQYMRSFSRSRFADKTDVQINFRCNPAVIQGMCPMCPGDHGRSLQQLVFVVDDVPTYQLPGNIYCFNGLCQTCVEKVERATSGEHSASWTLATNLDLIYRLCYRPLRCHAVAPPTRGEAMMLWHLYAAFLKCAKIRMTPRPERSVDDQASLDAACEGQITFYGQRCGPRCVAQVCANK